MSWYQTRRTGGWSWRRGSRTKNTPPGLWSESRTSWLSETEPSGGVVRVFYECVGYFVQDCVSVEEVLLGLATRQQELWLSAKLSQLASSRRRRRRYLHTTDNKVIMETNVNCLSPQKPPKGLQGSVRNYAQETNQDPKTGDRPAYPYTNLIRQLREPRSHPLSSSVRQIPFPSILPPHKEKRDGN